MLHLKKILYLESLRGIAALAVVFAHYAQFYYYESFFTVPHSLLEFIISKTPVNLIYNGEFAVCLFFVLSGYVLSIKFMETKRQEVLVEGASRRYFRLAIPVLVSGAFAYMLLVTDSYDYFTLYSGDTRYESMDRGFVAMAKALLVDVFFNYGNAYNTVYWTMTYEFFGSLLVYSFLALCGQLKQRWIIYLVMIMVFFNSYYLAFILGIILCDLHFTWKRSIKAPYLLICLVVGVILGSYPYGSVDNTMYTFFQNALFKVNYQTFYHIWGAALIILGVSRSSWAQSLLNHKWLEHLGKVSFSLYLFHFPILASLSFMIFHHARTHFSYNTSFFIAFIASLFATAVAAYISSRYVDQKAVAYSKAIGNRLFSGTRRGITNNLSND